MNILLIDALGVGKGRRYATIDVISYGPRLIAGILEKSGFKFQLYPLRRVLFNPSIMVEFDVLMLSAMSVDLPAVRKISSLWRKFNSEGLSIIGGPIASDPYKALLKGGFQIAVIGEGEETIEELLGLLTCKGFLEPEDLQDIKGVAFNFSGEVKVNSLRPIMDRSKFNSYFPSIKTVKNYPNYWMRRVYVEVVRGCSNFYRTTIKLSDGRKCINCNLCRTGSLSERVKCPLSIPPGCGYCSVPSVFGPTRSRDEKKIFEEFKGLIEEGCRRFILSGSDFLDYGRDLLVEPEPLTDPRDPPPNIDAIESLLSGLKSIVNAMDEKIFIGVENVKPSLVNEQVAKILGRYLNGSPIHIGCETGCEIHAYTLGRSSSPKEVLRAIKLLKRYGLRPYVYFIHGLPGQSLETVRKTVKVMEAAEKLGVEKLTVYRFQPLPMSAFGDFSNPPPSHLDPASSLIVEKAREINSRLKFKWIGRVVEAYIVKVHVKGFSYIGYPLKHGPVIFIKGKNLLAKPSGKLHKVKIVKVISDRAVEGVFIGSIISR